MWFQTNRRQPEIPTNLFLTTSEIRVETDIMGTLRDEHFGVPATPSRLLTSDDPIHQERSARALVRRKARGFENTSPQK